MNKEERLQRLKRVAALRNRALRLVLSHVRVVGNIEIAGQRYRVREFRDDRFAIDLEELHSTMTEDERFVLLEVRYEGVRVLRIKWDSGRSRAIDYRAGNWEDRLCK